MPAKRRAISSLQRPSWLDAAAALLRYGTRKWLSSKCFRKNICFHFFCQRLESSSRVCDHWIAERMGATSMKCRPDRFAATQRNSQVLSCTMPPPGLSLPSEQQAPKAIWSSSRLHASRTRILDPRPLSTQSFSSSWRSTSHSARRPRHSSHAAKHGGCGKEAGVFGLPETPSLLFSHSAAPGKHFPPCLSQEANDAVPRDLPHCSSHQLQPDVVARSST